MQKLGYILISLILLSSLSFAQGATRITETLCEVYNTVNQIIPIVAFVLFVLAGVAYASGQFFSAELRARAISWSMSMVTGAIIGLLITTFASLIITNLIPNTSTLPCS